MRLATVLGCLAALLLLQQVGGALHELSHLHPDPQHAPGKSLAGGACPVCGAFAALASPLGAPSLLAPSARPDAPVFPITVVPPPRVRGFTVHNRDPPLSLSVPMTA